jgi:probable rRNA maturation factor
MKLYIQRRVKNPKILVAPVKRYMRQVLLGEDVTQGTLTLVLTDDAHIRELNGTFRNKDKATDVLAFPMDALEGVDPYIGDVIVSLERAIEQAPRFENNPEQELARLITHGILHLLGYDHHSPQEGKKMKQAERHALVHYIEGSFMDNLHASK